MKEDLTRERTNIKAIELLSRKERTRGGRRHLRLTKCMSRGEDRRKRSVSEKGGCEKMYSAFTVTGGTRERNNVKGGTDEEETLIGEVRKKTGSECTSQIF